MLYFPIMSTAPRFYDRNRGFAMGVILSGIGIGGLVLAPTVSSLIQKVGVRWTLRILAMWTFVLMLPVAFVPRQPPGFEARRRGNSRLRLNGSLFRKGTFLAQVSPERTEYGYRNDIASLVRLLGASFKQQGTLYHCSISPRTLHPFCSTPVLPDRFFWLLTTQ